MKSTSNRPSDVRFPSIILVGEVQRLPGNPLPLLDAYFDLYAVTPQAVLDGAPEWHCETLGQTLGILLHWDEQSPAVLRVLKAVTRPLGLPVLALCPSHEAEQVAALVVGADDALPYPFRPVLLQAKLLAYHRRMRRKPRPSNGTEQPDTDLSGDGQDASIVPEAHLHVPETHEACRVGPLTLDYTARRFFAGGQLLALTPKEFDLMAFLMQRVNTCLTRDDILDHVWGLDFDPETSVLGTQIYTLRRKLAAYDLGGLIQTVRGVGYRLVAG